MGNAMQRRDCNRRAAPTAVALLWGLGSLGGAGCASGFEGAEAFRSAERLAPPVPGQMPDAGMAVVAGAGGTMASAGMAAPSAPMFTGEGCAMGEVLPCTCSDGVSMGKRQCVFDMASPTMGAFGACASCVMPPMPVAGAGAGGAGGSGGAAAGSGGTASGGMGGGGTSASGGSGASACDPAQCPPPQFGEACCTDRDECGRRLLLSCN